MHLKLIIISFFLIFFTIMLIWWINTIDIRPTKVSKDQPAEERIKVVPVTSFKPLPK